MDEKLICCQVCQVYFVSSASADFRANPSASASATPPPGRTIWPNPPPPPPHTPYTPLLCRLFNVFRPLCPCALKISLKPRGLKTKKKKPGKSADHKMKVCSCASPKHPPKKEKSGTVSQGAELFGRNTQGTDTEKMLVFSSGGQKVRILVTPSKCAAASSPMCMQTSNVVCLSVCHICLCHAMPCICAAVTRLISLLLAEWIKKTQIQCFFPSPLSVYAPSFHVVICTKGRIKAPPPPPPPEPASCFQIGERGENWGDTLVSGGQREQDSLSGESSGSVGALTTLSFARVSARFRYTKIRIIAMR